MLTALIVALPPNTPTAILDNLTAGARSSSEAFGRFEEKARAAGAEARRLEAKAASLATEGFDKAKEAAARLMEIVNGEADATNAATTEAEKLKRALEEMGDGSGGGAAGKAAKELNSADKALRDFESSSQRASDTFASLVTGILDGSTSAADALQRLGTQMLQSGLSGLFGNLGIGDVFAGLFSFDGGGYTGSGPRSGGVDGMGGFPAILHPQESVIDHTKGQGMGGGVTNLQVNIVNEGGQRLEETGRERRRGPNGQEVIDIAVSDSISSGKQDGVFKSRFGAQTQTVKR